MMGLVLLWEKEKSRALALSRHKRTQCEGFHQQARNGGLSRTQPCWHPDLGLTASGTVRNQCQLLKPQRLWYFVVAARAKTPGLRFTGSAGAVLRLSWWGQEEAGDQAEATVPVQAREATGLGLSDSGETESNGRNLLMQTDPCNSSNWYYAGYIPVIPFHGFLTVCLLVSGATSWESFVFFFSFHRLVLAGVFVLHPDMCCCSQKWRFLTPQQQTVPCTENEFCFQKLTWVVTFQVRCDLSRLWFCDCSNTTVFVWNFTSEDSWVFLLSALSAQMQTENIAALFGVRLVF